MAEATIDILAESSESSAPWATIAESRTYPDPTPPTPLLLRGAELLIWGTVLLLPFAFGGVRAAAHLPFQILTFLALALLIVSRTFRAHLQALIFRPGSGRIVIALFTILIGYASLQLLWLTSTRIPHPILGTAGDLPSGADFLASIRTICYALALFLVTRIYLQARPRGYERVTWLIIFSGLSVALTGLGHWFYDNGKLFWIFEPSYLVTSDRARWPFVNSNHFGDFLLIPLFVGLAIVLRRLSRHFADLRSAVGSKAWGWRSSRTRSSQGVTTEGFRSALLTVALFACALAILASLSRGAWLGTGIGLLLFLLLRPKTRSVRRATDLSDRSRTRALPLQTVERNDTIQALGSVADAPRTNVRRRRRRREEQTEHPTALQTLIDSAYRWFRILSFVLVPALFLLFLNQQGRDLVEGRIEYGLLYSRDDIRWTMYADSLKMLAEHPFFGIGLGTWGDRYFMYISERLGGINPVYLHSDPYQFLIEFGLVGAGIAASFIAVLFLRGARVAQRSADLKRAMITRGTLCALAALLIASLVEFPLRIPAIINLCVVALALLTALIDQEQSEQAENSESRG